MNSNSMFRLLHVGVGLCVASAAFFFLVHAQAAPQQSPTSPAFSARDLSTPPTQNWLKVGGSLLNQNWSPLKEINRENVDQLKAIWQTHLDGSGLAMKYSGEAQPVIFEGALYIVTGADDVFAISVETGEILWKYQANLDHGITTVCCGWTSRGESAAAVSHAGKLWASKHVA